MISGDQIRAMNEHAARAAAREGKHPFVFWNEEEVTFEAVRHLPNIGELEPAGWEELHDGPWDRGLLVDSSGGEGDGFVVGVDRLMEHIKATITEHKGEAIGFAIVSTAQFCVTICAYRRLGNTNHEHVFSETLPGFVCRECDDVLETVATWDCDGEDCCPPNAPDEPRGEHEGQAHEHNVCAHPFCEGEPEETMVAKCECGTVVEVE